jgi:hypothetical protein
MRQALVGQTGGGLDRGRAAVEREFGRLKNGWALLPLRVRGWIESRSMPT